jgi:ABC-2 type transport system permease protein
MIRAIRSELARLKSPYYVFGGIGLMTALGVMATTIVFITAKGGSTMAPPGGRTVSVQSLEAADGMFAGLQNAANMWGIVVLAIWAIAVTSDYSSGLIRLLVQAEPSRLRLLGGKVVALTAFTCLATLATTAVVLAVSPAIAGMAGVSTDAWGTDMLGIVVGGYLHLTLSALLWGVVGLFVGMLTRSTGVAIAVGIGYLLVFEMVVGIALDTASKWLPGSTFSAVAQGGSADMAFRTALLVAAAYAVAALAVAAAVFRRRDITA